MAPGPLTQCQDILVQDQPTLVGCQATFLPHTTRRAKSVVRVTEMVNSVLENMF